MRDFVRGENLLEVGKESKYCSSTEYMHSCKSLVWIRDYNDGIMEAEGQAIFNERLKRVRVAQGQRHRSGWSGFNLTTF